MTRVLLINPPSPERLGTPLLGQQYVAASLLRRGCEVRVIDAAARFFEHDADWILAEAEAFGPELVGVGLFTRWVGQAYRLLERLRGREWVLVAGGPHATVCPEEALEQGFDIAVPGEAERSIVQLVDWLEGKARLERVAGVVFRDERGGFGHGPTSERMDDLDSLALPQNAQPLYERRWYDPAGREMIPGGILTSRGCPARCTFCANYVTGRAFRYRSAAGVVAELNACHERYGTTFFPCWDDALTANLPRLYELCAAFERGLRFPLRWSAITRANLVRPKLLRALKAAGLVSVNFGVESGDDKVLRAIKKGLTTAQVVRALEWAKAEGLRTICNFMLGFPQETPAALERTLGFMQRITPLVDSFNTFGVVVPFPGTPLYDDFHERYGFTRWWLREECSSYVAPPAVSDLDRFCRHYVEDANLDLDFVLYSAETRDLIRACMKFKAEHNLRNMGLLKGCADRPVAAQGPTETDLL